MKHSIIITNPVAWDQMRTKYDIAIVDKPSAFPVLLILNLEDGGSCDILEGEAVTTPEQAAKLLSVCTPERLLAIPEDIRTSLLNSFSESEKVLNPGKPLLLETETEGHPIKSGYVALNSKSEQVTFTNLPSPDLQVGSTISIGDEVYTITDKGTSSSTLIADDPITGIEGIIEVGETVPAPVLPGLGDLPLDPGQLEEKHRIADLGDAQEHVLDVERAV